MRNLTIAATLLAAATVPGTGRATFLIRAGLAYELTETSSGMLRIRTVAGH